MVSFSFRNFLAGHPGLVLLPIPVACPAVVCKFGISYLKFPNPKDNKPQKNLTEKQILIT
jgi:hypothetical protein